jgi:hypothetical protein|tara:strand:- start:600 stop:797 length:198 start_codon:yes stop_codon:yes gene_type:complete
MTINSKNIGLISGPLAFIPVLFFFHPEGLNPKVSAILANPKPHCASQLNKLKFVFILIILFKKHK